MAGMDKVVSRPVFAWSRVSSVSMSNRALLMPFLWAWVIRLKGPIGG